MLAPSYIRYRLSWYKPILARGDDPAERCRIDVLRLPVRTVGEDTYEYVPYGLHSQLLADINGALRRLQDYVEAYIVRGEKVSPHQLPPLNDDTRALVQHLRAIHPDIAPHLLHHWCADARSGMTLLALWRGMWGQALLQEKMDRAPWLAAVNILLLKHMRAAIAAVPSDHPEHTDQAMQAIVGGAYLWAMKAFLKKQAAAELAMEHIAPFEAMVIPVTAMAFMYRQPEDALLGDTRHIILSYGMEPELVPRMRDLREQVVPGQEKGMLALLSQDRLGDHLLKRCWARLSLWQLAEVSGNGAWMRWVKDAKQMDQLLADPGKYAEALAQALGPMRDKNSFAHWFLAQLAGGRQARAAEAPWRQDESIVHAFLVFDEDVHLETERRQMERMWRDQRGRIGDKVRGAEADRALAADYDGGKLVFFQPDFSLALHSGKAMAVAHACLGVDWSDYLNAIDTVLDEDTAAFLGNVFMPGIHSLVGRSDGVFIDAMSGSGCQLRGSAQDLLKLAVDLRQSMRQWFGEHTGAVADEAPSASMCIALAGGWRHGKFGNEGRSLMFSRAVAQVAHAFARDEGLRRFLLARDQQGKTQPPGKVRILSVDAAGEKLPMLYNAGLMMTDAALAALRDELQGSGRMAVYRVPREEAAAALSGFRLPAGFLDVITIAHAAGEGAPALVMRIGQAFLAGELVTLHEVLEPASAFTKQLLDEGLRRWTAEAP